MTNQQAPESLPDPSPDQLRAIARTARNSSGSASDDCGPLAYVLRGWRAAAIAFRAQQAALVEAKQPAAHVQNPGEIEHVVGDVSKNGPESNMAQQPAPSAAAAGEVPLPLLVRDIAADLGTTPIQVCTALAQLGFGGHSVNMAVTPRMAKSLRAHFASPTPQADSSQDEPLQAFDSPRAKALMRAWEEGWAACRDAEYVGEEAQNDAFNSSHTLTLCIAEDQQLPAPQADSQPAPVADWLPFSKRTQIADRHGVKVTAEFNALVRDVIQTYLETHADRAARAPADSVTAPAGGVSLRDEFEAHWRRKYAPLPMNTRMRDDGRYGDPTIQQEWEAWQAAAPPAQAADSVLEDAARLEQIAEAIRDYHHALDMRKHGGLAESAAFSSICNTMGMHWNQGEEAARRAARKQGGAT